MTNNFLIKEGGEVKKKVVEYSFYHRHCNQIGTYEPKLRWHCCEADQPEYTRTDTEWYKRDGDEWEEEPYNIDEGDLE